MSFVDSIVILRYLLSASIITSIVVLIVSKIWYRLPFNKSIRKQYFEMKDAENEEEKKKRKRKHGFLVLYGFLILVMANFALFSSYVFTGHVIVYVFVSFLFLNVLLFIDIFRGTPLVIICRDMILIGIILFLLISLFFLIGPVFFEQ